MLSGPGTRIGTRTHSLWSQGTTFEAHAPGGVSTPHRTREYVQQHRGSSESRQDGLPGSLETSSSGNGLGSKEHGRRGTRVRIGGTRNVRYLQRNHLRRSCHPGWPEEFKALRLERIDMATRLSPNHVPLPLPPQEHAQSTKNITAQPYLPSAGRHSEARNRAKVA